MKKFAEFITEKKYKIHLDDKDYQILRQAGMRGKFSYKFSRDDKGNVEISSNRPEDLAKELENLIDSGASSWYEILGV